MHYNSKSQSGLEHFQVSATGSRVPSEHFLQVGKLATVMFTVIQFTSKTLFEPAFLEAYVPVLSNIVGGGENGKNGRSVETNRRDKWARGLAYCLSRELFAEFCS